MHRAYSSSTPLASGVVIRQVSRLLSPLYHARYSKPVSSLRHRLSIAWSTSCRRILGRTLPSATLVLVLAAGCHPESPADQSTKRLPEQALNPSLKTKGVPAMPLARLDGSSFSSATLNRDSATVLFLLSPECPLCLDYAFTFRSLAEEYQARGIRFVGLFPGEFFSELQIKKYCSRFRLEFPMVLDPDYALTRALGANTTPEALLLDETGQIIYQGGIDNWAYEVGQKRLEPTEHYLRDALAAFEAGQKPALARTQPVGCLIE